MDVLVPKMLSICNLRPTILRCRESNFQQFDFLFGKVDKNVLYLIDFGLCRKYISKTGKHIKPKNLGKFTGTSRYASVYAMAGNEQSRRDDIESIGYMIIFFMKKRLPWQGIKGN